MRRLFRHRGDLLAALAFLCPNLLGLLVFTLFPLGFSMVMAFTNWNLRHQNMFKPDPVRWVGFDNFWRLLQETDFWRFLGNTLFLMIGIPFAIAGSLFLAILLSRESRGSDRRIYPLVISVAGVLVSAMLLGLWGMGASAMELLLGTAAGGILLLGAIGGRSVYRTLLYLPSFTSGVAIFVLWKDLYNPDTGPINLALRPALRNLQHVVRSIPPFWPRLGLWLAVLLMVAILAGALRRLGRLWREGDLGTGVFLLVNGMLMIPTITAWFWFPKVGAAFLLAVLTAAIVIWQWTPLAGTRQATAGDNGLGTGIMPALLTLTALFVVEGLGIVCFNLPAKAAAGLHAPSWLASYYWAKPGLMIMSFWIAVGSNNMLLYLAGLSNVPPELYEAADLDGASRLDKFRHVTWPMLAPTTFFICIMSIIGGLQGGWDMAVAMTQGGPAGATTTLSYEIYAQGFQRGAFDKASAVAWIMFVFVLLATLASWKFGNRYVNE